MKRRKPILEWGAEEFTKHMNRMGLSVEFIGSKICFPKLSCSRSCSLDADFEIERLDDACIEQIQKALDDVEADGALIFDVGTIRSLFGWSGSLTLAPYRLKSEHQGTTQPGKALRAFHANELFDAK